MGWIRGKKIYESRDGMFLFECPGCGYLHAFYTKNGPLNDAGVMQNWTYNGDGDSPTINPSLNVNSKDPKSRCHSWIRNGTIQFLSDSFHSLAGQTVPIPDWDD